MLNNNYNNEELAPLLNDAIDFIVKTGQATPEAIRKKFNLSFRRSGEIIKQIEKKGFIGEHNGTRPRQVLISAERWEQIKK